MSGRDWTPKKTLVKIGKKVAMKMMKNAESSPMPNQRIARGIQAIGGIGLNISIIGVIVLRKNRFRPKNSPKAVPTSRPTKKPTIVRFRLAKTCGRISPLTVKSTITFATSNGEGRIKLFNSKCKASQAAEKSAIDTIQ